MYRLNFAILFLTMSLILIGCSGDSIQTVDEGAVATIDAQNTRIAELSAPTARNTPLETIVTEEPAIPSITPSPTSTPEDNAAGIIWKLEGLSGVYPIPEIGMAYAYREAADLVQSINLNNGEIVWSLERKGRLLGADMDYVYTLPFEQRVDAFDVETGEFQWSSALPERPNVFTMQHGLSLVRSNANFLLLDQLAISKSTGEAFVISGSYFDVLGDVIIVNNGRGYIEPDEPLWDIGDRNLLAKCGEMIFDHGSEGSPSILAIDARTGAELWTTQSPGYARLAFCPGSDKVDLNMKYLYLFVEDFPAYNLVAIDGQTGEIKFVNRETIAVEWNTDPRLVYEAAPIIWGGGALGINIFSQPKFGITEARNEVDNAKIWENSSYSLVAVIGGYENVIVGVQINEYLTGVDKDSGIVLWEIPTSDIFNLQMINGSIVYRILGDGLINVVDVKNGNIDLTVPLNLSDAAPSLTQYGENQVVVWNYFRISVLRLP
ncbi:MAG: PQQ-binding-like beta-propeller repeat protein [Anaerolineales bacterium]|nr:PQQ-binding-like beta-propeller repeat protein [Anaerolineales bacterium]